MGIKDACQHMRLNYSDNGNFKLAFSKQANSNVGGYSSPCAHAVIVAGCDDGNNGNCADAHKHQFLDWFTQGGLALLRHFTPTP
jgi:hypothetical protein